MKNEQEENSNIPSFGEKQSFVFVRLHNLHSGLLCISLGETGFFTLNILMNEVTCSSYFSYPDILNGIGSSSNTCNYKYLKKLK